MIRFLPRPPNRFNDLHLFSSPLKFSEMRDCGDFCGYSTSKCRVFVGDSEQRFAALSAAGVFSFFASARFLPACLLPSCNPCGGLLWVPLTTPEETHEDGSSSPAYALSGRKESIEDARRIVRTSRNILCGLVAAAPSSGRKP